MDYLFYHNQNDKLVNDIFQENNEYQNDEKHYQLIIDVEGVTWLSSSKMTKAD